MIQKIEQGHEYLILVPALHDPSGPGIQAINEAVKRAGAKVEIYWHHGSGSPVILDVTPPKEAEPVVNLNELIARAEPEPASPLKVGERVRVSPKDGSVGSYVGRLVAIDDEMALIDEEGGVKSNVSLRHWDIERA